jgi:hypothetical protein
MIVASIQKLFKGSMAKLQKARMSGIYSLVFALLIIVLLFLIFRLPGLGYDISNSDAARWHRRSESFLIALKEGDLASTYQHYQPGITLMWINAPVKQVAFWYQLWGQPENTEPKTLENADYYPIIHGVSKAVMVGVLMFLLAFQVYAVIRLFSGLVGVIFGFLMATEPYLIGIDRWFHLTSFETYFGFSSFLALLLWQKFKKSYFLGISAMFFVLAVYSKVTSLIILPVLLVVFAQSLGREKLKKFLIPLAVFFCFVLLGFLLLLPALWVEPFVVLDKMFRAISSAVTDDPVAFQISGILYYAFYPLILLLKLSPITLILSVLALVNFRKWVSKGDFKSYTVLLLLYVGVLLVSLTFADKKIDRYVVSLIPALLLAVAVYIGQFRRNLQVLVLSSSLIFTLWVSIVYFPVYSAYYSPIFGSDSTSKAMSIGVYDNSGEYYAQAAFYLNDAGRSKKTFVPHNVESFSYYYKGVLLREFAGDIDYIVLSASHLPDLNDYPGCSKFVKAFGHRLEPIIYVFGCN